MAMAKRLFLYTKALEEVGVKQLIFAAKPKNTDQPGLNTYKGIRFINSTNYFGSSKNFILRRVGLLLTDILTFICSYKYVRNYDVIFYIGESWIKVLFFKILCLATDKKLVIELNEHPYITYGDRKLNFKLISSINQFLSLNVFYKGIDGFVVISTNLNELLIKKGYKKERIIRIPILVDTATSNIKDRDFSKPFLFHAGTLNETKDGIVYVFQAFARIVKEFPEVRFVLTNKTTISSTLQRIFQIISENGIDKNVVFLDHISNEEVLNYMNTCTFAIINKPSNRQNYYNFSTKLGEYLINEVPLITTAIGEAKKYLVDFENSLIIEPNDVDAMVAKMRFILMNKDTSVSITQKGKQLALLNFLSTNYSDSLKEFINSI